MPSYYHDSGMAKGEDQQAQRGKTKTPLELALTSEDSWLGVEPDPPNEWAGSSILPDNEPPAVPPGSIFSPTAPISSTGATAPTSPKPGPDWLPTAGGGWVPPGHPDGIVGGTGLIPSTITATPAPGDTAPTSPKPGADWVATSGGGWAPPGHPAAVAPTTSAPSTTTPVTPTGQITSGSVTPTYTAPPTIPAPAAMTGAGSPTAGVPAPTPVAGAPAAYYAGPTQVANPNTPPNFYTPSYRTTPGAPPVSPPPTPSTPMFIPAPVLAPPPTTPAAKSNAYDTTGTALLESYLANPYSLSNSTVAAMKEKEKENTLSMYEQAGNRQNQSMASRGMLNSGMTDAYGRAQNDAMISALTSGYRDLDVKQALQNRTDEQNALAAWRAQQGLDEGSRQFDASLANNQWQFGDTSATNKWGAAQNDQQDMYKYLNDLANNQWEFGSTLAGNQYENYMKRLQDQGVHDDEMTWKYSAMQNQAYMDWLRDQLNK